MSSRQTQILQAKNVTNYLVLESNGLKGVSTVSASQASGVSISTMSGSYNAAIGPTLLETELKAASSSSLDILEIKALHDIRLNPQLYNKHIWNSALAAGSSSNDAYMLAYPNS